MCRSDLHLAMDLADRDGLWGLLVVITARKAGRLRRDEGRLKRCGGAAVTTEPAGEGDRGVLEQVLSREPDPEFAALAAEEHERLLGALGDDGLRAVARWRLEGHSVEEIAGKFPCSPRSIKRKLKLIREVWEKELAP